MTTSGKLLGPYNSPYITTKVQSKRSEMFCISTMCWLEREIRLC